MNNAAARDARRGKTLLSTIRDSSFFILYIRSQHIYKRL